MIKWHGFKREFALTRQQISPGEGASGCDRRLRWIEVRNEDRLLQGWQRLAYLVHDGPPVMELAAIRIAIDGEQDLRLDLLETINHAPAAEIRRTTRPDRAQAGAGQEGHDRLRDVG